MAGAVLATASMAVLVYAVVRTDTYAWGSPQTLGGLAAAVVLGGAFVLVEQRSAVPLVRLGILRARSLSVACLVIFLIACAQFGAFYFASLYVQGVLHFSPVQTGLAFVPFSLGVIAGTIAAGVLMRRAGHRPPLVTVAATVTSHQTAPASLAAVTAGYDRAFLVSGILIAVAAVAATVLQPRARPAASAPARSITSAVPAARDQ